MSRTGVLAAMPVLFGVALSTVLCQSRGAAGLQGGGTMKAKQVVVRAGQHERESCPVQVTVEESLARLRRLSLVDEGTGMSIAGQIAVENGKHVLTFIAPSIARGETKSYSIAEKAAETQPVTVTKREENAIDVVVGGLPLTAYHTSEKYKKPFLYPLFGSGGARLTRGWPMENLAGEPQDHPHQKSFWVAHGDVNGVDFWGEGRNSGSQRTDTIEKMESGDVYGVIRAHNSWLDAGGKKVVSEVRQYQFYNTPPELRIIDLEVTFTGTEGDVKFGDTKEGGIAAFRVNPVINADRRGEIRNSLGAVGEREAWGKRASWCDYSGAIDGKKRGITVFDNPANPRYPACWHVRGYGLMAANYFGYSYFKSTYEKRGDFVLPAGESITFRYRILIHDGDAVEANVAERYVDYITPPVAKVSS